MKWLPSKHLTKMTCFKLWKYIKLLTLKCGCKIHIFESPRSYRFLLNRNLDQFVFIFFKECFFTNSVTGSVSLFRLENHPEFSKVFLCDLLYRLEDTKRNVLDISDFRNQFHHRIFFRE